MTHASVSESSTSSPRKHYGLFGTMWTAFMSMFSPKHRGRRDEVVCISVHRSFHLWFLILFGWICSTAIRHFPDHVLGWSVAYLWVLLYTFSMLLFDVNISKLLVTTLAVLLVWISAKYLEAVRHVMILGHVVNHFRALRPEMSGGFASVISWILFVQWFFMLMEAFRAGRVFFSPNTIKEIHLVSGDHDIDRSGLNFRCDYPNLLEFLLGFGAGRILAEDSSGNQKHSWPHIVGLYFKWSRIDDIIHQRETDVGNPKAAPVEVELTREPGIQDAVPTPEPRRPDALK